MNRTLRDYCHHVTVPYQWEEPIHSHHLYLRTASGSGCLTRRLALGRGDVAQLHLAEHPRHGAPPTSTVKNSTIFISRWRLGRPRPPPSILDRRYHSPP